MLIVTSTLILWYDLIVGFVSLFLTFHVVEYIYFLLFSPLFLIDFRSQLIRSECPAGTRAFTPHSNDTYKVGICFQKFPAVQLTTKSVLSMQLSSFQIFDRLSSLDLGACTTYHVLDFHIIVYFWGERVSGPVQTH